MGFITYKQGWIYTILGLLGIDRLDERNLRNDLHKMTGHGLARLSNAIEEMKKNYNKSIDGK